MLRKACSLVAAVLTAGCAAAPLGEDWERLGPAQQDARAVEALEELFVAGVDGAGTRRVDREVLRCDPAGVEWRPVAEADARASALRWADISSVETQAFDDQPARPETLYVYLERESPSAKSTRDLVQPPLAGTGLVRPYVELRSRPRWSRNTFIAAIRHLRGKQKQAAAEPAQPSTPPAAPPSEPPGEDLDSVEAKLRKLKTWHEEGLIDDDEYATKRQELLKGL